ncbi:hypothetical protein R3P38DRAFT_3189245 [Favolaschia claudopus]|uniref:Uncharacterized protein n=1 Tax=Favolaschia claudopus TaxID=2862362 RepID=A0AAW0BQ92_9AGAR
MEPYWTSDDPELSAGSTVQLLQRDVTCQGENRIGGNDGLVVMQSHQSSAWGGFGGHFKTESDDVATQANGFPPVSCAHGICFPNIFELLFTRLSKIPRPLFPPEMVKKGRSGYTGGEGSYSTLAARRKHFGSFISASDIRFFEDRSFKHATTGFREWVVAGWSPTASQWITIGRIIVKS